MKKKKASRPKKKNPVASIQIADQIWPLERNILFRPDRMKYVRKLIPAEGCVFCVASTEKISFETLCVYQSKYSAVVLNKYPYNSGHVLVLPRRHCASLLDLKSEEYQDLMETLRKTMQAVQQVYHPGGINMGLNQGAVAGAGIPDHLHFHVIPRWSGDLNFFPLVADTKVVVESLETSFERLLAYFQ